MRLWRGQPIVAFVEVEATFDDVHTFEHPYCGDLTCWCHTDVNYHLDVVSHDDDDLYEYAVGMLGGGR